MSRDSIMAKHAAEKAARQDGANSNANGGDTATQWKPTEPGETLAGTIVAREDNRPSKYPGGDPYTVLAVRTFDGGEPVEWRCSSTVPRRLLAEEDPQPGDEIVAEYEGTTPSTKGNPTRLFGLTVERPAVSDVPPDPPAAPDPEPPKEDDDTPF